MWHSEGLGGQQVLKGFQCCLAHSSLRELVPEDDRQFLGRSSVGRWCLMSGSVEARVMASGYASRGLRGSGMALLECRLGHVQYGTSY